MEPGLNYKIKIGSQSSGGNDDRLMISFATDLGMDCGCGYCVIELADENYTLPAYDNEVTIELGDDFTRVFSGKVATVETISAGQKITAYDSFFNLAKLQVETSYQEISLDEIVEDLIKEAGLKKGKIERSIKIPSYNIFKGASALSHIRKLSYISGLDLYSDGEGKVSFAGPETKGDIHSFEYGVDIQKIDIRKKTPVNDGIEIYGEGSAGTKGADKFYWLPDDLSAVKGNSSMEDGTVKTGPGNSVLKEYLPVIRSGESLERISETRMKAKAIAIYNGYLKANGSPKIIPGDLVKIKELPENHNLSCFFKDGGSLRVRNVKHLYNFENGFVTILEF